MLRIGSGDLLVRSLLKELGRQMLEAQASSRKQLLRAHERIYDSAGDRDPEAGDQFQQRLRSSDEHLRYFVRLYCTLCERLVGAQLIDQRRAASLGNGMVRVLELAAAQTADLTESCREQIPMDEHGDFHRPLATFLDTLNWAADLLVNSQLMREAFSTRVLLAGHIGLHADQAARGRAQIDLVIGLPAALTQLARSMVSWPPWDDDAHRAAQLGVDLGKADPALFPGSILGLQLSQAYWEAILADQKVRSASIELRDRATARRLYLREVVPDHLADVMVGRGIHLELFLVRLVHRVEEAGMTGDDQASCYEAWWDALQSSGCHQAALTLISAVEERLVDPEAAFRHRVEKLSGAGTRIDAAQVLDFANMWFTNRKIRSGMLATDSMVRAADAVELFTQIRQAQQEFAYTAPQIQKEVLREFRDVAAEVLLRLDTTEPMTKILRVFRQTRVFPDEEQSESFWRAVQLKIKELRKVPR